MVFRTVEIEGRKQDFSLMANLDGSLLSVFGNSDLGEIRTSQIEIPAIERYLDRRILEVAAIAEAAGEPFLILSGEYGLLKPLDPIPCYDHLLMPDEVEELALPVTAQLRAQGVTELVYYTVDPSIDPMVVPYRHVITTACARAGIAVGLETIAPAGS